MVEKRTQERQIHLERKIIERKTEKIVRRKEGGKEKYIWKERYSREWNTETIITIVKQDNRDGNKYILKEIVNTERRKMTEI
jgi:hypothetical protein